MSDLVKTLDTNFVSDNEILSIRRRRFKASIQSVVNKLIEFSKLDVQEKFILACMDEHLNHQKKIMLDKLHGMNPYEFEKLIGKLLLTMNYKSFVTKKSNDLGVDLIASIKIGITEFIEVIQVKRQRSNIQRPVLDQLRGALPYFNASRGTIITLGGFSPGCIEYSSFQGTYPINLIDGDTLIELLFQNKIGLNLKTVELLEIDESYFDEF